MREMAALVNSKATNRFRIRVAEGQIERDGNRITKAGLSKKSPAKSGDSLQIGFVRGAF